MSKNYEIKNFDNMKKGSILRKTVRIQPKGNAKLNYKDVKALYNRVSQKRDPDDIHIVCKTIDGTHVTLKTFDEDDIKEWDDPEYFKNKVKDTSKFFDFHYVDFYIKN